MVYHLFRVPQLFTTYHRNELITENFFSTIVKQAGVVEGKISFVLSLLLLEVFGIIFGYLLFTFCFILISGHLFLTIQVKVDNVYNTGR